MSEITRRNLVVNLTEQEITDFSKELARITTLQAEIEEEKKVVTSSYKEKLDRCISESRSLARKISARQDFREVDCEWRPNYDIRIKRLVRLDTLEEIEVRKLTNDELQDELDFGESQQEEHPPECPKCEGDGEYYGEEGQVYCDCPAGEALKEKEKYATVEPSASICATCLGECRLDNQSTSMSKCSDFRDTLSPEQERTRDDTCNGWRDCTYAFKCFVPANEEDGTCFKSLEESKELEAIAVASCRFHGRSCEGTDCDRWEACQDETSETVEPTPDSKLTIEELIGWGYSRNEAKILAAGFSLVKYDRENKTLHTSCSDPRAGWVSGDTHATYSAAERELKCILENEKFVQINMNGVHVERSGNCPTLTNAGFNFYRAEGIIPSHGTPRIKIGPSWTTWKKLKTPEECQAAWDELLTTDSKALADSMEPVTTDRKQSLTNVDRDDDGWPDPQAVGATA